MHNLCVQLYTMPACAFAMAPCWCIRIWCATDTRVTVCVCVKGAGDPGYGQTSRMVLEAALCLALQVCNCPETLEALNPKLDLQWGYALQHTVMANTVLIL